MAYIYDLADTWNAAGTTFTAIKMNVTDSASAAGSLLMDLQVGGVSRFRVDKGGGVILPLNSYIDGQGGGTDLRVVSNGANSFIALAGSNSYFGLGSGNVQTTDTRLFRDAANTLAQRNGVNAQAFRVYNTFTDASNYERGIFQYSSNTLQIGHEGAGTGNTGRTISFRTGGIEYFSVGNPQFYVSLAANRFLRIPSGSGGLEFQEGSGVVAPAANSVRIYAEDNGAGKTRLMALFATGAAVQIAIEP